MAYEFLAPIKTQYRACFCPCLFAKDMCDHASEGKVDGPPSPCFIYATSLCCPVCFTVVMAQAIGELSGIEESRKQAVLKSICCLPCYGSTVTLEYLRQKKLKAMGAPMSPGGGQTWMVPICFQYKAVCLPCMVGKEMYEYFGESGSKGFWCGLLCPLCMWCCAGSQVAYFGYIHEWQCPAFLKMLLPFTAPCYMRTVYAEYRFQQTTPYVARPARDASEAQAPPVPVQISPVQEEMSPAQIPPAQAEVAPVQDPVQAPAQEGTPVQEQSLAREQTPPAQEEMQHAVESPAKGCSSMCC